MFAKAFTYASLASAASAHIAMTQPTRYELDGGVINAPLYGESQAPFPCGTKTFSGVESSVWEAGSTQTVMFKGTAVHGGGSCQFSVTTDTNPTENSVWKVIKSIEGGCPAKNQAGNIEPGNNEAPLAEGYDVEVPELPQGSYTFAWTWFNKIGNREMYMNCAPIEITGGSGSVDPNSLPDMMVANIPQTSCKTTETIDIKFPDAGENVVQFGTGSYGPPEGECGGSGGQVTPPTNTDPDTPPSNQNPSTPTTSPVAPPPATTETPVDTPPSNQNPDTTVPDTPETPAGACTEGNWKCIDGSNYSRCASGAWTAPMALAVGTKCEVGEGESLNMS